jgi:hypothetical protein
MEKIRQEKVKCALKSSIFYVLISAVFLEISSPCCRFFWKRLQDIAVAAMNAIAYLCSGLVNVDNGTEVS